MHFIQQFYRYLVIGVLAFLVDLCLFYLLIKYVEFSAPAANLVGKMAGGILSFSLNSAFTFKVMDGCECWKTGLRYMSLLGVNSLLFLILFQPGRFSIDGEIGLRISIDIISVLTNFILLKFVVFGRLKDIDSHRGR